MGRSMATHAVRTLTRAEVHDMAESQDRKPCRNGCNILVVDDENGPRQALRILLKEDYEVFLAEDAEAARNILKCEEIDVVITDLRMPRESGVSLMQWIKGYDPTTEVIILTGYGQLESATKAVECGAFAYVEKPFDNATIIEYVRKAIERRRGELERRHLEELALEANRFGTLGRFVSGMLHDLSTPLSVINSYIELIQADSRKTDLERKLEVMRTQTRHCTDIVRSAMGFLRHESSQMVLLNINDIVEACLEVSGTFLSRHKVEMNCDLARAVPLCRGDFVLVRQAILNLITNAVQAMENQPEARRITLRTWAERSAICVAVKDTGPGIPQEVRGKIFNTFFTTKTSQGTGLGLAAVRHIMKRHKGEVTLCEDGGRGAEFVLRFPVE